MTARGDRRMLIAAGPMLLADAAVARWGDLAHRPLLALLFGLTWVAFVPGRLVGASRSGTRGRGGEATIAATRRRPGGSPPAPGPLRRPAHHQRCLPLRLGRSGPARRHLAVPVRAPGRPPGPAAGPAALSRADARTQKSGVETLKKLPTDKRQLQLLDTQDTRSRMNHDRVTTIYPPVAEAWFAAVALVTPWSWGTHGLQIGSALLAVGFTYLLGRWFTRRDQDPRRALLWGWCPTVVIEASIGAHADVLAAVLLGGAVIVLTGQRPRTSARSVGSCWACRSAPS